MVVNSQQINILVLSLPWQRPFAQKITLICDHDEQLISSLYKKNGGLWTYTLEVKSI